ncbi:MAG: tetratricopeptide repeat protein [Rhodospirillaceae bacterium]|nr:tetratricopeptide repeat protein [Rhodospirillaceae bacterium]
MKAKKADQALREAVFCHQQGQLDKAEDLYRSVLSLKPRTHLALHNLGVIALDRHRTDEALRLLEKSIRVHADYPPAHTNLALAFEQAGRLEDAVASLKRAIRLAPGNGGNYFNLGNILKKLSRFEEAADAFRQAILADPDDAEAHTALGTVLAELGHTKEGIESCRRAIEIAPHSAAAEIGLGNVLRKIEMVDEAEAAYRRAIALDPDDKVAQVNLARLLTDLGHPKDATLICEALLAKTPGHAPAHQTLGSALFAEGRREEALEQFDRAIELDETDHLAHVGRGTVLCLNGKMDEAEQAYRAALGIKPDLHKVWTDLGRVLESHGRYTEAIRAYSTAINTNPDYAEAIFALGWTLLNLGLTEKAMVCYRRGRLIDDKSPEGLNGYAYALGFQDDLAGAIDAFTKADALKPGPFVGTLLHYRRKACDWHGIDALTEKALASTHEGITSIQPFAMLSLSPKLEDLQIASERVSAAFVKQAQPPLPARPSGPNHDKLRIGYLSGDMHQHPVTLLIAEMLEQHDRDRFEIIAYSYGPPREDSVLARMKATFDRFVDIRPLPFEDAARRIQDDDIDILVDLTGHTRTSRSVIAAFRPAPIQVSYLGFPGTMGAGFIDYIITDPYLTPMDDQPFFTEKIVHLPDGYQPSDSKRRAASTSRAAQGLPENALVFAAFNNNYKISADVFDIWMRLLKEAPGSALWLLADTPYTETNLRREAQARGIDAERLVFAGRVKFEEYLGRLALADLFLDCHPYNAGATANDALWMGLPVLTCSGETYVSRMAGSLLTTLGLPELITHSLPDYEARALELIRDPGRLAAIRAKLAERRETSALFDTPRYTRYLEAAYTEMWAIHAAGEPPRPFAVPL